LPTLGRPTMPVFKLMLTTDVLHSQKPLIRTHTIYNVRCVPHHQKDMPCAWPYSPCHRMDSIRALAYLNWRPLREHGPVTRVVPSCEDLRGSARPEIDAAQPEKHLPPVPAGIIAWHLRGAFCTTASGQDPLA